MKLNTMLKVLLGVVVAFLASVGIGASIVHFFRDYYNPGFFRFPFIVTIHVVLGGAYLILAPFQFLGKLRSRAISYHRWVGRFLVGIGTVIGLSSMFLAIVIPFSGIWESVINGFFGLFFVFAIIRGFTYIRSKNYELHREWMIRAFSLGLSIATMRLILVPLIIISGKVTPEQAAFFSILSFTISFFIHVSFAEVYIRKTRGIVIA